MAKGYWVARMDVHDLDGYKRDYVAHNGAVFKKYDALNESIEENVRGMRVVKSFARENYEKRKNFFKNLKDRFMS